MLSKEGEDLGSARRVLVVDDNPDLRETLAILLEMLGYSAASAANGQAALELALRDLFDVAIIDIGLPDMDGYEVARRLRDNPHTQGLLLVALTGYVGPENQQRAAEAGFDLHLPKPVDIEDLKGALAAER